MRILGKFIRVSLIIILALLIVGIVAAQTDYAHKKLAHWIETKTNGSLKIGRIEGILPFWTRLQDVHYQTETLDIHADEVRLSFLPASLLYGRLLITDADLRHVIVQSTGKKWPSFPLPIDIHRFTIQSLSYNDLKDLNLSGMGVLEENFFLKFSLTHPCILGHTEITIDGSPEDNTIHTITHYQAYHNSDEVWIAGTYQWDAEYFSGTWSGKQGGLALSGNLEIDIKSAHMTATGIFLDRPFTIRSPLNPYTAPILLDYGDRQWQAIGRFDMQSGLINFQLHAHGVSWKKAFVPEIEMHGSYQTGQDSLLTFALNLPEFTVLDPAYEVFPQVSLSVTGSATRKGIIAHGSVQGLSENPFTLDVELPLCITSTLHVDIDEEAPFNMRIHGYGTIDPLLAFLENASLIAHGCVDIDLQASGTWQVPELSGHFVYSNGQIESFPTGALFHGIHLEMEGAGRALQIRSLQAHDAHHGDLTGGGSILWDPDHHFPFSLNLFAHRYHILGVDPLTLTVDADVMIAGSTQGMTVSGSANLVEGHLAIPSGLPVQVPTVEVCYINPICAAQPEEELIRRPIPIIWDLQLNADRHLYIDGRGLDSEWRGHLHITGEQKDFQFQGKLRLVRGRFDIINQTFDLVHGRILIAGLEPHAIFIDLKGDYELPCLTASILVTGNLDSTRIAFCSNPPMNTNQILSWILFGEDINELTPMQACRLASILVSLSGKYTGPKTFDKIKDKLGIDVFSITDCDIDSADLTFQVGKYLSQGTFVGINKSISGDFDSASFKLVSSAIFTLRPTTAAHSMVSPPTAEKAFSNGTKPTKPQFGFEIQVTQNCLQSFRLQVPEKIHGCHRVRC